MDEEELITNICLIILVALGCLGASNKFELLIYLAIIIPLSIVVIIFKIIERRG